ncbi:MAG: nicotinate-nucleotide adenylyltransferase [Thermomicrobiales bacterium]|nr:nicotinate-nucleotide adenylyltransferase [Thermomicrobiales bacterium]
MLRWSGCKDRRRPKLTRDTRVGIYGGTFDPIHVGHLISAEIMRFRLGLNRVIFLPAGAPPHKPGRVISSGAHRLAMLQLAVGDDAHFEINTIDLDRPGWSYTADSLKLIKDQLGDDVEMYFLMGQDSLRDFPTWYQPGRIAELARLGVALRPAVDVDVEAIEQRVPEARNRIEMIPIPLIGVSATEIRANVRADGPYRFQVLPTVADYIESHRLYREADSGESQSR